MFVKHGCPRRQQSQNMTKISKSYILTPPNPKGHVMSVNCEEPIDELTVQVWLLYHHPNFKYCTLFVSGTELWTDRQTDDPITRCPRRTFQAEGIKRRQKHIKNLTSERKKNKRPKGPHIVHPSTMCHLFEESARAAVFVYWSAQKIQTW